MWRTSSPECGEQQAPPGDQHLAGLRPGGGADHTSLLQQIHDVAGERNRPGACAGASRWNRVGSRRQAPSPVKQLVAMGAGGAPVMSRLGGVARVGAGFSSIAVFS